MTLLLAKFDVKREVETGSFFLIYVIKFKIFVWYQYVQG